MSFPMLFNGFRPHEQLPPPAASVISHDTFITWCWKINKKFICVFRKYMYFVSTHCNINVPRG